MAEPVWETDLDTGKRILVVDDDVLMLGMLKRILSKKFACEVVTAETPFDALRIMKDDPPSLIVADVRMPGLDGIELLRRVKEQDPTVSVILMSGFGTIEIAVEAMREGAYDFLPKPFNNDELVYTARRALERTDLLRENRVLHERLDGDLSVSPFVGRAKPLKETLDLIRRIADTDVTVLIRGESGTGKEIAARAIHDLSSRSSRKMIAVNCPALPEDILESELFGYVKGAFTGATSDKKGLFLEADGSTILLDEIGDMPVSLQTKLLRVLQEKEIRPLGSNQNIPVDVRVLASTNQDLETKISQGLFREDLFYRLNVVTVRMPSLAEIPEDIEPLARHFLRVYGREYGRKGLSFAPETISCLMRRHWKGNVRELQNVIKRAVLLASGHLITPGHLFLSEQGKGQGKENSSVCFGGLKYNEAKEKVVESFSRAYISRALEKSLGNVTVAAQHSGLERQALQRLMRRYGIRSEDFRGHRNEGAE